MNKKFKIVNYENYCYRCQHRNVNDTRGEEPCSSCLETPVRINSSKPINFIKDVKVRKRNQKEVINNESNI